VTVEAAPLSYRSLMRVRGLPRLFGAALLGRVGVQMQSVALVLFALDRFRSPSIAGVAAFATIFPGLAVSPVAGALLDRRGRTALIMLDYCVAASSLALIVVLAKTDLITPDLLIGIATLSSLTGPLSNAGTRSLLPVLVPRPLWDRANALDSAGYVCALIAGAPLAGVLAGALGRPAALLGTAAVFVAAAAALLGLQELPGNGKPIGSLLGDAWAGLVYVASNPTLRGLALSVSIFNMAQGITLIALPVLVFERLHHGAPAVGALWALLGIGGAVSGFLVGHHDSEGRERSLLVVGMLAASIATATLAAAPDLVVAAGAMLLFGIAQGPLNIGLFSLRQRRTDHRWFGRAFAVSVSLNYLGVPIGSAIAGPLLSAGVVAGLAGATACALLGAGFVFLAIPRAATAEASLRRSATR